MITSHDPDPEFERFLEWQITSAMRRRDRFSRPAAPRAMRSLTAAAIAVVSLLLGAGGVAAASRIQGGQQRQALALEKRAEIDVVQMKLNIGEETLAGARRRVAAGVAGQAELQDAERAVQLLKTQLQRLQLDLAEVQLSGQPAREDVTSPLVSGRDFVSERLRIDQQLASVAYEAASQRLREMQRRVEMGLMSRTELSELQLDAVRAESELLSVQSELAVRQRFVAGGLGAADATRQRQLGIARAELHSAQAAVSTAAERYQRAKDMFARGLLSQVDLLKAQLAVLEAEKDLKAIQAQVATLQRSGE